MKIVLIGAAGTHAAHAEFADRQHRVVTAKAESVADGQRDLDFARLVRNVVKIALGIRGFVVQGGRYDAVPKGQYRQYGFQRADRADRVAQRRLWRIDRGVLGIRKR